MKKKSIILTTVVSAVFLFAIAASFNILSVPAALSPSVTSTPSSDNLQYDANVEVYFRDCSPTDPTDCADPILWHKDHNVLYGSGMNGTRDTLKGGPVFNVTTIGLCNATAGCGTPVKAANEAYNEYANCGLAIANGTATDYGIEGNWTISNTFTSTCDAQITNLTRLKAVDGTNFAGNTFTLVTLQTNDQLTINWSIGIS